MDVGGDNHLPSASEASPPACANCGAPLTGRFCSACGQQADHAAHSVGHFLWEAIEALTHADSRFWITTRALVRKPGFLTREFFAGRRARYVQPLRLYLILSVVFFVLSGLLSLGSMPPVHVQVDKPEKVDCANLKSDLQWGGKLLLPRLKAACMNMVADNGHNFSETMVHNIGRAMFVFLPLMASLMKLLYWRPPRYYLEHLVLLIHNHACVFALLTVFMLATHWMRASGWITPLVLALMVYLLRYLYRSMKVMYAQSGWLTLLKFSVLVVAYLTCATFMLLATAFVSAATL